MIRTQDMLTFLSTILSAMSWGLLGFHWSWLWGVAGLLGGGTLGLVMGLLFTFLLDYYPITLNNSRLARPVSLIVVILALACWISSFLAPFLILKFINSAA